MNETDPAPESNRRAPGHKQRRYKIDRTDIAAWSKALNDDQRTLVFWLDDYARAADLDLEEIARRLKQPSGKPYSRDSVYQLLTGRRPADQLANMLSAIEDLRKIETARQKITRIGFVETDISRRVFQVCDATRNFGKMGVLIGPTHIGKTTALREYTARNNHGATHYVRMPAGGAKGALIRRMAPQLGIGLNHNDHVIASKILESFDERQMLICDEFHQCVPRSDPRRRGEGVRPGTFHTVEWLRELHDMTGCAILLSATPTFDDALKREDFAGIFKQTFQRALITCRLPDAPTKKSLAAFAKHFGLDPAAGEALDLQTMILREDSLGRWISILEGASRIAAKQEVPLAWDHVLQSHAALLRLESGD